jgi:HEAT repeat protein
MAARALGRLRHEAAIDRLTEALRDPEWWVRTNAAEALRAMGPAGLDALRRMLADDDTYARHQAVLMLEEAGVLDVEVGHLASADTEKRTRARELVLALVDAGQLDRLRGLREEHSDPKVRAAIAGLVPEAEPPEARS